MINRTILVGNLTRDPQFFKTQSGIAYVRFSVATTNKYKDKEETAFISCIAWRSTAEYINQYASKGNTIVIEGHIVTGSYEDKTTGKKTYTTDVMVDKASILRLKEQNRSNDTKSTPNTQTESDDVQFDTGPLLDITSDDLPY